MSARIANVYTPPGGILIVLANNSLNHNFCFCFYVKTPIPTTVYFLSRNNVNCNAIFALTFA